MDLVEPQLQTSVLCTRHCRGRGQCAVRSDGKWQAHRAEDGLLSPWLYLAQPGLIIAYVGLTPGRGGPPFGFLSIFFELVGRLWRSVTFVKKVLIQIFFLYKKRKLLKTS